MSRSRTIVLLPVAALVAAMTAASAAPEQGVAPTGSPIAVTSLPTEFVGSTIGAPNSVATLASPACSGVGNVPGGEQVYTFLAGPTSTGGIGSHVDFYVTPSAGFDATVYALTELGDGTRCVVVAGGPIPGNIRWIHMEEILVVGQRYYVYVDGLGAGNGSYSMRASNDFIGVELQTFSID